MSQKIFENTRLGNRKWVKPPFYIQPHSVLDVVWRCTSRHLLVFEGCFTLFESGTLLWYWLSFETFAERQAYNNRLMRAGTAALVVPDQPKDLCNIMSTCLLKIDSLVCGEVILRVFRLFIIDTPIFGTCLLSTLGFETMVCPRHLLLQLPKC